MTGFTRNFKVSIFNILCQYTYRVCIYTIYINNVHVLIPVPCVLLSLNWKAWKRRIHKKRNGNGISNKLQSITMTLSHASTSSSSTASTSMRSPREVDLGRFVSQLGYTSKNPASELLLRPGSLHNLSNGSLKLDLDSSFKSFSFPSLELSNSSNVSKNLSTIANNKSAPISETEQPKEDVNEKTLHLLEATNLEKRTIGKNKDEAPELNAYHNSVDLKRKKQEDKKDDRGSDCEEKNARDSSHTTSVERFASWAERLSSSASLSRNHLSEAPLKMLRSATFSFLELVNVKGQDWVNDMKQKFSHLESKELDNINSLANVKDTLFLDRASIAFKAHPSPIPNQILENIEKEDCIIVLPISMRIEFNSTAFGESICAKINVPGTIKGMSLVNNVLYHEKFLM